MSLSALEKSIQNKSAKIAVVGLGYVGLPVAALLAEKSFQVLGFEIKANRVDLINQGISPIEGKEPGLAEMIERVVGSGRLRATMDFKGISDCDMVLVNVETPVNDQTYHEYQALRAAVSSVGNNIRKGALVVIESTIMPGTMEKIVLPLLQEMSGMQVGKDFYLGNCPERVMPGKLLSNLANLSRVVGGDTSETAAVMKKFYAYIVDADIDETDWITAELVKTAENAYRDVNIAFANEVAKICETLGADVWRVRELVRKSPGREMLMPGSGVGGHCIPKDPWLLVSSVRDTDLDLELIPTARKINTSMPAHLMALLKEQAGEISEKKILLLGYAYLEESDDIRNSPAAALAKLLEEAGAQVVIHDPFVPEFTGDIYQAAKDCDAALIITGHSAYAEMDFTKFKECLRSPLVIDGRNLLDREKVRAAGINLITLGDRSTAE
jgi:UDP-N-acetyl-D-mannosaminuronic acid dehydrogenase